MAYPVLCDHRLCRTRKSLTEGYGVDQILLQRVERASIGCIVTCGFGSDRRDNEDRESEKQG
jgi:hypothetical protein